MCQSKLLEKKKCAATLHKCYCTAVNIVEVVDCVLTIASVLENVSGAFGEDINPDCDNDEDSRPEEEHEYGAVVICEGAIEDQIAVEGESAFLDLEIVSRREFSVVLWLYLHTRQYLQSPRR